MGLFSLLSRFHVPRVPGPAREHVLERRLIIGKRHLPGGWAGNLNCPALIRAPHWIPNPLGQYYLYFSTHSKGEHLGLATASSILGPWTVYPSGVAHISRTEWPATHVAAPDPHVESDRILMHLHTGGARSGARQALSADGLNFQILPRRIGAHYFRAFFYEGAWYALSKGGRLHRSNDGGRSFIVGQRLFPRVSIYDPRCDRYGNVRHVSIEVGAGYFDVFHTRIGDAPERILKARVDAKRPWRNWKAGPPEEVMRAEMAWEGAALPIEPSRYGMARTAVNQLRDPYIFRDEDGCRYLAYTVAGESGIGIARLA